MLRECERTLLGRGCETGTGTEADRAALGSSNEDEAGGTDCLAAWSTAVSARMPPAAVLVPAVEVLKFDPSIIRKSERA